MNVFCKLTNPVMDLILYWRPIDLWIVPLSFPGWITEMQFSVGERTNLSQCLNWKYNLKIKHTTTIHSLFIIITFEHLVSNMSVEIKVNLVTGFSLLYLIQKKKALYSQFKSTPQGGSTRKLYLFWAGDIQKGKDFMTWSIKKVGKAFI